MSVVRTGYQRKCDGCGAVHEVVCSSPRRAMAAAKRDGWRRLEVVVGQREEDEYIWVLNAPEGEHYRRTGKRKLYDIRKWQDLCGSCLDKYQGVA